jgi:hypothetical protein
MKPEAWPAILVDTKRADTGGRGGANATGACLYDGLPSEKFQQNGRPLDGSPATDTPRPTGGRHDCNSDAMAGFAAAHG